MFIVLEVEANGTQVSGHGSLGPECALLHVGFATLTDFKRLAITVIMVEELEKHNWLVSEGGST